MTWTQCKHGGPSPAEATLSADLTAASARIAELDSMLDRSCSAYQDDIERLNTRIAELEDWQRRAVGPVAYARARDPKGTLGDICDQLIKEATR